MQEYPFREQIVGERSRELKHTLSQIFPRLIIDQMQPIRRYALIDDVSMDIAYSDAVDTLRAAAEACDATYIDYRHLVSDMTATIHRVLDGLSVSAPVMFFPGSGGNQLQEQVNSAASQFWLPTVSRRTDDTGARVPYIGDSDAKIIRTALTSASDVAIIMDDSINGGGTARAIRNLDDDPARIWIAATPVMFLPTDRERCRFPGSVEGFDPVLATHMLYGTENPVPANFMSSLMKRDLDADGRVDMLVSGAPPGRRGDITSTLKQVQTLRFQSRAQVPSI